MELWSQMVRAALLGTERGAGPWTAEGHLGGLLASIQAQGRDAAVELLECAAVVDNYRRAGQGPARQSEVLPEAAETDPRPALAGLGHLRLLLQEERLRPLLLEWLAHLGRAGVRPPDTALPMLLTLAVRQPRFADSVRAVLGPRGRWLAAQRADWGVLLTTDEQEPLDDALWETGSPQERLAWLRQTRRAAPDAARERLAEVWSQEGARERRILLEALRTNPQPSDTVFLEQALSDRGKEVRRLAAELLARLPDSALQGTVRELSGSWLRFEAETGVIGRLKGSKGQLVLELPESWDRRWTALGLVEKAPNGKGQKAWWLEQLLGLADPRHGCERWGLTPAEILGLLEGHAWREPLLAGWTRAAALFERSDWARALLELGESDEGLWAVLEAPEREALIQARLEAAGRLSGRDDWIHLRDLVQLTHAWSGAFSGRVIAAIHALVTAKRQGYDDYHGYEILRHAARHLDPELQERLETTFAPQLQDDSPWRKLLGETIDTLRLRNEMIRAIDSTSARGEP